MSFLELSGLNKRFGATAALGGIDLTVDQGSRVAIVGPSGSGKTTLLRIVAGFDVPDAGRVVLDGEVVADGPRAMPAHARGIGVVTQDGALFPHLTVGDNVGFGLRLPAPDRGRRIAELLDMVELDRTMANRRPDQLSGGQQQRVALARALAIRPRLMLLDEPFSALDTALRASLRDEVSKLLGAAGIATILITHDQAEALTFADKVAVMRNGLLQQVGTPRDVYFQPRDRMVAEFMGDCLILPAVATDGAASCALGVVPLAGSGEAGACSIMLRPEQILLRPAQGGAAKLEGEIPVRLLRIDFAGRTSTATVALETGGATLTLPGVGSRGLSEGGSAMLTIVGTAHSLPG